MTRRYPLPATDDDPRFTIGLVIDVAKALAAHGFPSMTQQYDGNARDLVELQQALFRLIYTDPSCPSGVDASWCADPATNTMPAANRTEGTT